jgi:hypothetical protein
MESYKGLITKSKRKQPQVPKVGEIYTNKKGRHPVMGDRQERNGNPEIHEERHKSPRRRVRNSPLNIQGEQHQLPTLPQGALPTFSRDGVMDPKRHLDLFLNTCDIRLIEHDYVMVILFLQKLTGLEYEWYKSLPTRSIEAFDDIETIFFTMYSHLIAYHTLLTKFTQIHLKKGERIRYFNTIFFKTNHILEEHNPNVLVIFRCYKNAMP